MSQATPLSSPFIHSARSTEQVMQIVCLALIPGALIQFYFFGWGILINLILCGSFAISVEAFVLYLRKRPILSSIKDNSALLTGLLIALAIPPIIPIWMSFIGVFFAIVFAKQLYGGLGFNPFNPAMIGYVLLLISFPIEMTSWLPSRLLAINTPSLFESLQLILFSKTLSGLSINDFRYLADGFTMATPLDLVKTEYTLGKMTPEIYQLKGFQDNLNGWFYTNIGFLCGGIFLLVTGIIRWQIPVAVLTGLILTSSILHVYDADLYSSSWFHLTTGASMLGVFFIATDPVSAATTPKGRLIYGGCIGFLVIIIRTFGGYPEAMAFAVLLLNIAAPTLDHYTQPKLYGEAKKVDSSDE